jgi:hypothetical protein
VAEDVADDGLVGEERQQAAATAAVVAGEGVEQEDPPHELGPEVPPEHDGRSKDAPDAAALLALPVRVRAVLDQGIRLAGDTASHADFPSAVRRVGRECKELLRQAQEAAQAECTRLRERDYRELSERKAKLEAGVGQAEGKDADALRGLIKRTQDQLAAMADRDELLDRQAQVLAAAQKQIVKLLDAGVRQDAFRPANAVDCELLRDGLRHPVSR